MVLNGRLMNKLWTVKYMKRSSCSLIRGTTIALHGMTKGNHKKISKQLVSESTRESGVSDHDFWSYCWRSASVMHQYNVE